MTGKHWTNPYIGIPYRELGRDRVGVDCWGLVRIVYSDHLGINLPSYTEAYTSVEEHRELGRHISAVTSNGVWNTVEDRPQSYDLAVFRRGRFETHVGIVVNPGLMLHIASDDQSKLEHYSAGRWCHRLNGIYRHVELTSRAAR